MRRPLLIASSLVALAATACPSAPAPAPEPGPPGPADGTRLETTSTGHNVDGLVMIAPGERLMLPVSLPYQGERVRIDHISVIWHVGAIEADIDRPVTVSLIADSGNNLPVGAFLGEHVDVVPAGSAMHALNGLVVSDHALGFDSAPHFWLGLEVPLGAPDALALSVDKSAGKALVMRHDGTIARYDSLPLVDIAWRPTSKLGPRAGAAPRLRRAQRRRQLVGLPQRHERRLELRQRLGRGARPAARRARQGPGLPARRPAARRPRRAPHSLRRRLRHRRRRPRGRRRSRALDARRRSRRQADGRGPGPRRRRRHGGHDHAARRAGDVAPPPDRRRAPARAWLRFETLSGAPKVAATHAPSSRAATPTAASTSAPRPTPAPGGARRAPT
ncbi:MAG: hypothetical protein U1F43_28500 [Myxococcota bacterium]